MNESLLPARYAKALYKFALDKGLERDVYNAMHNLTDVFESPQGQALRTAIANPFIVQAEKRSLIIAAAGLQNATDKVKSAMNDFLTLLFKNNRIAEFRDIVYAYDSYFRKQKNISRVHVTWAVEPEAQHEERMKQMIASRLKNGEMEFTTSVDPTLIGGFKIAIDNEQLDASVQNELRQLRQQILSK